MGAINLRDKGFKDAFANDPRAMLHIMGSVPLDAVATVEPAGSEVVTPSKLADGLAVVTWGERTWLHHSEALSWLTGRETDPIALRVLGIIAIPRYAKLPLDVNILLMLKQGAPKRLPRRLHHEREGGYGGARPRWIRLWKVSAKPILEANRVGVMHLVPLMKHTRAEAQEAARRIKESGDENLMTMFRALACRVYDRSEVERWLPVMNQALIEIAQTTSFGQELVEVGRADGLKKGLKKGRREGRLEGRLEEAEQRRLRLIKIIEGQLARAFPRLVGHPALAEIGTVEQAEQVLDRLLAARTSQAALEALTDPKSE
jgi:hypothetical protein